MIPAISDERLIVGRSASKQTAKGRVAMRAREECKWSKSRDDSQPTGNSHLSTVTGKDLRREVATDGPTVCVPPRGADRATA